MVHGDFEIDPYDPRNMSVLSAFKLTQAAPHSERLKDFALVNMAPMSVTRATFHVEMSPLKAAAQANI